MEIDFMTLSCSQNFTSPNKHREAMPNDEKIVIGRSGSWPIPAGDGAKDGYLFIRTI